MNAFDIARLCAPGVDIEVVLDTGSTNADLLARVPLLQRPVLLIAENQSAGRGRAGRSWLSAPGDSLTFSLAWRFAGPLHRLIGLPLAVGVALAEALDALGVRVQLKWPNDLLKDGAKLGGILIETAPCAEAGEAAVWAVIGVGINLSLPEELEERIGQAAASAPWLAQMDRNALAAALLDGLSPSLRQFDSAGFAPFCARWNRLHAFQGRTVAIIDRGVTEHEGVAAGVDESARLLLDTRAGRVEILSGDVSLRAKDY